MAITKQISPDGFVGSLFPLPTPQRKYANISVRWAILDLLNKSEGMSTSEIAEALTDGGIQTRAANFANNVSAVLSTTMLKVHKEVEQMKDGRWMLTSNGESAIAHIRTTRKFQTACGISQT